MERMFIHKTQTVQQDVRKVLQSRMGSLLQHQVDDELLAACSCTLLRAYFVVTLLIFLPLFFFFISPQLCLTYLSSQKSLLLWFVSSWVTHLCLKYTFYVAMRLQYFSLTSCYLVITHLKDLQTDFFVKVVCGAIVCMCVCVCVRVRGSVNWCVSVCLCIDLCRVSSRLWPVTAGICSAAPSATMTAEKACIESGWMESNLHLKPFLLMSFFPFFFKREQNKSLPFEIFGFHLFG